MKIIFRIVVISFILTLTLPFFIIAQEGSFPSDEQWFNFSIEQNGKSVPVKNNRISLEKAPFTLVIIMKEPLGVLVNFSEDPTLFKGFLKNKPLDIILPEPDLFMGMGEASGNEMEVMLIDEVSPHYLYYTDGASHRFSSTEIVQGHIICRRVISNFTTHENDFDPYQIEILAADTIYISFLYGDWDENYNRLELQKEALKVSFVE